MVMVFFILLNYGDFLLTKIGCFRLTLFGDYLLTLTVWTVEEFNKFISFIDEPIYALKKGLKSYGFNPFYHV